MLSRPLAIAIVLLQLPFLPFAIADAPTATGPDADGAWTLGFDLARDAAGPAHAILDVTRIDADGSRSGTRDLGAVDLPAGASRYNVSFLPSEGSGHYVVGLSLDGARVGQVEFDADAAGNARTVSFVVADAPTCLNLTNDDVNADGKIKAPGDALITRAVVSDANGVGDLDGILWSVEQSGASIDSGILAIPGAASNTTASLELRYDHAPIAVGDYTMALRAMKSGAAVANASRRFSIKEVAPTFVSGAIANLTPDVDLDITVPVVLADKNGAIGPGPIELRVYRGSVRAESAGFNASFSAPTRLPDAAGAAMWSYPLALHVPANATPASYRVSIYANSTLLGAVPFDVHAVPTLASVVTSTQGGALALAANTTGDGVLTATLSDGHGAVVTRTASLPADPMVLAPPRRGDPLSWSIELRAREGGAVIASRNGTWAAPFDGPAIGLIPLHVRPRLPATWAIDAADWNASTANVSVSFTRWDGAPEPALTARVADGKIRVDAPANLTAGRYQARATFTWANGSASQATWQFDAGPWVELTLGDPVVAGRNATIPLHNAGGLAVTRIVVEAQPSGRLALRVGNASYQPQASNGRSVFTGLSIPAGGDAELTLQLPDGPLASGRRDVELRVLARVDVG